MNTPLLTTLLAALALGSGAAFAGNADSSANASTRWCPMHDAESTSANTRADVLRELEAWRENPVTHDGYLMVGSEASFIYVGRPDGAEGETRAEVQRELAQWRSNPVTADGWRYVGGEAGYAYVGNAGETETAGKTREEVRQELAEWRSDPVTADGWREVGGEAGYLYVGRTDARSAPTQMAMPGFGSGQQMC